MVKKRFKEKIFGLKLKLKYYFGKPNIFQYIKSLFKYIFRKKDASIYHAKGTHIITGYMGKGKTLLMNCIINSVDKTKYFFITNLKEFNQENVYTFNLDEVFDESKQAFSFPQVDHKGRKLYAVIMDEINLKFNRRLNKTSKYNNQFIGLVEFLVSSRHQGVNRVYFIGQKLELQDSQLQSLFYYRHDCLKCKKFPFFYTFKRHEIIEPTPYKIIINNYVKMDNEEYRRLEFKRILLFFKIWKWKYKVKYSDLDTYNTKALGEMYARLPKVEIKT